MRKICIVLVCLLLAGCGIFDKYRVGEIKRKIIEYEQQEESVKEKNIIWGENEYIKKGVKEKIEIKGLPLKEFIKISFEEVLEVPYVVDSEVENIERGLDVTINERMTKRQYLDVIIKSLAMIGVRAESKNGVYFVYVENPTKERESIKLDKEKGVIIVPVKNAIPSQIASVLEKITRGKDDISVMPFDRSGIILVSCPLENIADIKSIIKSIDVPVKQVYLEITIAEVTLTDSLNNGLLFFLESAVKGLTGRFDINPVQSDMNTIGIASNSEKFKMIFGMLSSNGLVKVVSSPYLMCNSNENASLSVGTEVPILTKTSNTIEDQIINEVSYRKTGVIIDITPVVIGNQILINLRSEVSRAITNNVSNISSPSVMNRTIQTKIVVDNNQTIIIGGIIEDTINKSVSGLPGISGIVSEIVNNNIRSVQKTEMVMIIRPVIVSNQKRFTENHEKTYGAINEY
ncbi:MAG: hypothetical protein JXC33_07960 [Deltaproteobacteria bacterium]|nr:hypothetical protein [Deltaproteobacteria bacterium]